MGIYEAIADNLLKIPKVNEVLLSLVNKKLDNYKFVRKMIRNKIISHHISTNEPKQPEPYDILDKDFITFEDMTKLGLTKEDLKNQLDQLDQLETRTVHPGLLNILKETYNELLSRFPETNPVPTNPVPTNPEYGGRGKKSRKYKSNKSKSRKSRKK